MNLLQETLKILERKGHSSEDVFYVSDGNYNTTWDKFAKNADFEYDNSYGNEEINPSLQIVGKDWWLERGNYDGSEWWEYKTLPNKPKETGSIEICY